MNTLNETYDLTEATIEDNVVRNAKILGYESKNGRIYLKSGIDPKVYENSSVYINHKKTERMYEERIGSIKNVILAEQGVYGDLLLNPKHKLYESVIFDIKHNTPRVGLSHCVEEWKEFKDKKTGKIIIESIQKVRSVDLVCDPATTQNIFEQEVSDNKYNKLEESYILLNDNYNSVLKEVNIITEQFNKLNEQLGLMSARVDELQKVKNKPVALLPRETHNNYDEFIKRIKS